jgi:hypothetical protein
MTNDEQLAWDILSTPNNADFKQYRNTHSTTWLTKDRKILLMRDMTTEHLISCMNMLEALKQDYTVAYEGLISELKKRGQKYEN